MTQPGQPNLPLRVAIIGSGPAAFYAADHFLKQPNLNVEIDMFDRLPTPFGLVRGGVAPDHQKIKSVTKIYDGVASDPRFQFYGNVELGRHIHLTDLKQHYHQVLYATGAQTDRRLGIPGEDLAGSFPATEFVAWYNGHPDYADLKFDLSAERVMVVGVGNVAIDVARILCLSHDELAATDIADYALEALSNSNIKEVYLLGRRGPAQAAFTNPELKEVGELADADVVALPQETELDPLSQAEMDRLKDRTTQKKVEMLQAYSKNTPTGKKRKLIFRFLISPVELIGDPNGHVSKVKLVKNVLVQTEAGSLSPKATDQFEELDCELVFRSVGYRGVPLEGVPFHDKWGVILNEKGRVLDPDTKHPRTGEYCTGWIKRGPSGVIGTNKPDSVETVTGMLEDAANGSYNHAAQPDRASLEALLQDRQPLYITYPDWKTLDAIETEKGEAQGRPRVKFTTVAEMLKAVGKI
jgi:ferredoxin/flavodoxin---NADP+ reductase